MMYSFSVIALENSDAPNFVFQSKKTINLYEFPMMKQAEFADISNGMIESLIHFGMESYS